MTAHELAKKLLAGEDLDIFIEENTTDFKYGLLNSVTKRMISFSEDPADDPISEYEVIVLSDE